MPTGIAIDDAQLFDAAERVLAAGGPGALTSRAVTAEAGCAKGVLHRHFPDFDAFLAALIADRAQHLEALAAELDAAAGSTTVIGTLSAALARVFGPVAVAVLSLVVSRPGVGDRLRRGGFDGIPILTQAARVVSGYLAAEQRLGRLRPDADVAVLGPMLIGTAHLAYAETGGTTPPTLRTLVASVVGAAVGHPDG